MSKSRKSANPIVEGLAAFSKVLDKAFEVAVKNPESLPGNTARVGNPVTLAPRIPEAGEMVNKMVANAAANAERWLANVLQPRKSAIGGAKKAAGKYKAKMQEALADDRWRKGIDAIDEDSMYEVIRQGGSGVFASGIERRKAKITKKFEKMRPLLLALTNTLDAMPTDTDAQREAKMIAAKRGMVELGKKLRG